jgi:hypothetical protein
MAWTREELASCSADHHDMIFFFVATASGISVFSGVCAMRTWSCARLQRQLRAYAADDDGALVTSADASHVSHAA